MGEMGGAEAMGTMRVRVRSVRFLELPMGTRFPFRYGIASMTELPHVVALAEVEVGGEVGGEVVRGVSAEGLPPKWFTKNPETVFEEDDLPEMLRVVRHAAAVAEGVGECGTFFGFWRGLYEGQMGWAAAEGIAPLLANLGTALVERAVLDGYCRKAGRPLWEVVRGEGLGIEFGEVYGELEGVRAADVVPAKPLGRLRVRHTVGLGDPLSGGDVAEGDGVDDGLPFTLEENIREYGLTYFKIKLSGDFGRDRERMLALGKIFASEVKEEVRFTMDGNENYRDIGSFREHWEALVAVPEIGGLVRDGLIMVEQPLHRDHALGEGVGSELANWDGAPPLIIDESDGELGSVPRALELGYAGTSHKNCKGVVKGLLNAALVARRGGLLSAEDLANVGPVALPQDLAVVAMLGIAHVERNGHHYFRGLSMWPEEVQEAVLAEHGDLYGWRGGGYAALEITKGMLEIGSVNAAPFGVGERVVGVIEGCGLEALAG